MPAISSAKPGNWRKPLVAILAVTAVLHLLPFLISGVPYGTDTWYLLGSASSASSALGATAQKSAYLMESPVPSVFSFAFSQVIGTPPAYALPVVFPLLNCLVAVFVFLIARGLTRNLRASLFASLAAALTAVPGVFYSGVTLEGFSICLALVAVYLLACKGGLGTMSRWAPAALALLALALSHQIIVVYLGVVAVALLSLALIGALSKKELVLPAVGVLLSAWLLYTFSPGFFYYLVTLGLSYLIPFVGIVLLAFLYIEGRGFFVGGGRRFWTKTTVSVMTALIIVLTSYVALFGTSSFASQPSWTFVFAVPYFALALLALIGVREAASAKMKRFLAVVGPWAVLLAAITAYFAFFSTQSVSTARLLGQTVFPVALLAGLGFEVAAKSRAGLAKGVLVGSILILVVLMALPYYLVPFAQGPFGGSQLAYSSSDLSSMSWAKSYCNVTVMGDYRYSYLAAYYNVTYGNILSLEGIEKGGLGPGVFLLSQAYYYRGYFPGGLVNLKFPAFYNTVLPRQDLSYTNGRIELYYFAN